MKTNQLIKQLSTFEIRYSRKPRTNRISFWKGQKLLAVIEDDWQFAFSVDSRNLIELDYPEQRYFLELLTIYTATPLSEREDESKFKVHLWSGGKFYVNVNLRHNRVFLNSSDDNGGFQTIFTESEYEVLRKIHSKYAPYLPPFDKDDLRFEMVKDGDRDER